MNYKMIVLDLDGTLTNRDKVITDKTRQALMEAQKRGKKVVLASGRPTYGVVPLAEELELGKYGGCILSFAPAVEYPCGRYGSHWSAACFVVQKKLPAEANRKIIGLAQEERVSSILTYQDGLIITDNEECPYVKIEAGINHLKVRQVGSMADYVDFSVPKFLMCDDGDYLALTEARVKAALGRDFSVYRSEPFFLEILPKGIDKAQSLSQLLKVLGIEREEMIACGDGYNDISMIQYAGLGVAMENAVLPVRKAADYVTLSNNDDGVAHVVEKFLL